MKREISLEEILIKQQDSTINTDIFNIVDELTILLVQDNDLNPDQLKVAHRKFNHLRDIKEKIQ